MEPDKSARILINKVGGFAAHGAICNSKIALTVCNNWTEIYCAEAHFKLELARVHAKDAVTVSETTAGAVMETANDTV